VSANNWSEQLAEFERHKKILIGALRKVHRDGPNSKPFDEDNTWRALIRTAGWYFARPKITQNAILPARRIEKLSDLAKALHRAGKLTHEAMQSAHLRFHLFRAFCAERNIVPGTFQVGNDPAGFYSEMGMVATNLATLESVTSGAVRDVRTKAGPPGGAGILSMHDIIALAGVYRRGTNLNPHMGAGPFARFVEEFLTAIGRGDDIAHDYVVEALKYARKQKRRNPGS